MSGFSLLDTEYAKISGMDKSMAKVVKYLINEGRGYILNEDTVNDIFSSRWKTNTPLSMIFENITNSSVKNMYTVLAPTNTRNTTTVPDLLSLSSIVIDLKGTPATDILKNMPMYHDKVVLNIGNILNFTGMGQRANISDTTLLQRYIVAGALCRSYLESKHSPGWLSPSLGKFIIKTYSMLISAKIAELSGLSYAAQIVPAFFLACYMTFKVMNISRIPNPAYLFDFLGNASLVNEMMNTHADLIYGRTFDKNALCDAIATVGGEKLRNFNAGLLNQYCANIGIDNITNIISTEFPPYWVLQLIMSLSGTKTKLLYLLKQYKYDKEAIKFVQDLAMSRNFIDQIENNMK